MAIFSALAGTAIAAIGGSVFAASTAGVFATTVLSPAVGESIAVCEPIASEPAPRNSESAKLVAGIGGFCQHTIVERDSITTRVVMRWPDQIGRRISRFGGTVLEL